MNPIRPPHDDNVYFFLMGCSFLTLIPQHLISQARTKCIQVLSVQNRADEMYVLMFTCMCVAAKQESRVCKRQAKAT